MNFYRFKSAFAPKSSGNPTACRSNADAPEAVRQRRNFANFCSVCNAGIGQLSQPRQKNPGKLTKNAQFHPSRRYFFI
jgi:hypothetical protein